MKHVPVSYTHLDVYKRQPQELIADGRIRDLVIEFDRLRDGQPV